MPSLNRTELYEIRYQIISLTRQKFPESEQKMWTTKAKEMLGEHRKKTPKSKLEEGEGSGTEGSSMVPQDRAGVGEREEWTHAIRDRIVQTTDVLLSIPSLQ
ncbi:hypothetical protein BDQ17DRAFT_1413990 [Cyathus striatus]|nr:hypothetical protein BDQ17DRAFT_1413990 [Cyathus striatus]